MYKMLVLDLDGTLLDDYKEIPAKNVEAIERLYDDFGIIPVIATARPLEVARYIANKGGRAFQTYIIATNGAIVLDLTSEQYLMNRSLEHKQIERLIGLCKEKGLEYEFMTTKCEVADAKYSYRRVVDPMYDNMGITFNYQNDLEEYISKINEPIPLFAVNGTEEELGECYKDLKMISGLQISKPCIRTTPEKDPEGKIKTLAYYDIMREGVTKASAITTLADYLGIKKEEIIAIGDGGNDVEMFEVAGLKIAMKNGVESLKKMADVITLQDNNAGGVGLIIDSIHRQLESRTRIINHTIEEQTTIKPETQSKSSDDEIEL